MRSMGFTVRYRNTGHWDIGRSEEGRLFRLRGGPGKWIVLDERSVEERSQEVPTFKEQSAAMSYICAELMHELIIAEGQKPIVIESWNV
jgi:hypothetical protein